MYEFLLGFFIMTGLVFWLLAFAWFVGWVAEKCGITNIKESK
jgi:hypothetical protein